MSGWRAVHTHERELKILPRLVVGDKELEVFLEKDTTQGLYDGVASLKGIKELRICWYVCL